MFCLSGLFSETRGVRPHRDEVRPTIPGLTNRCMAIAMKVLRISDASGSRPSIRSTDAAPAACPLLHRRQGSQPLGSRAPEEPVAAAGLGRAAPDDRSGRCSGRHQPHRIHPAQLQGAGARCAPGSQAVFPDARADHRPLLSTRQHNLTKPLPALPLLPQYQPGKCTQPAKSSGGCCASTCLRYLPFAIDIRLNQIPEEWHQIAVSF